MLKILRRYGSSLLQGELCWIRSSDEKSPSLEMEFPFFLSPFLFLFKEPPAKCTYTHTLEITNANNVQYMRTQQDQKSLSWKQKSQIDQRLRKWKGENVKMKKKWNAEEKKRNAK